MIKVVIVEDEPAIGRAVAKLLRTISADFLVAGIAGNGREGLNLIVQCEPQVVFTDIIMPGMDGLEMMEQVKAKGIQTLFVVLSGHAEFDYIKRALPMGILDYLLKPVTTGELELVLEKVRKHLRESRNSRLMEELHGSHAEYGLEEGSHHVALVCLGTVPGCADRGTFPAVLAWSDMDYEKYLREILIKLSAKGAMQWIFPGMTSAEKILIVEHGERDSVIASYYQIYDWLCGHAGLPVTFVYQNRGVGISSIGGAARLLRQALAEKSIFGESRIFSPGQETEPENEDRVGWETEEALLRIRRAVLRKQSGEIETALEAFWEECRDSHLTVSRLCSDLGHIALYVQDSYQKIAVTEKDIQIMLADNYSYEALSMEWQVILKSLEENGGLSEDDSLLAQVKRYMEEHFREPLTKHDIAQEFHFAPSYLSRIYKEKYGISIGNYLTRLKIEEAKRRMAQNPQILIKEIAAEVGYKDPYYFSKVFRKETGSWPTQFF